LLRKKENSLNTAIFIEEELITIREIDATWETEIEEDLQKAEGSSYRNILEKWWKTLFIML
jgi:hypothetical protein